MRAHWSCSLIAVAISIALPQLHAQEAGAWATVENLTHKRPYIIETSDRTCTEVRIEAVTREGVRVRKLAWIRKPDKRVELQAQGTKVLSKSELFRISDGLNAFDIVYSARSSWSD